MLRACRWGRDRPQSTGRCSLRASPCVGFTPGLHPTHSNTSGMSIAGGDDPFELEFGGEAVAIAPYRQHRQLSAAFPVAHDTVPVLEPAIDLGPLPFAA